MMKVLIVEDEFASREVMNEILSPYAECDVAVDGEQAVSAFKLAHQKNDPYQLICMDIMMPKLDGQKALKQIREIETELGIRTKQQAKVIMTTALDDKKNVIQAFLKGGATSYITKPIYKQALLGKVREFGLID